MGAFTTALVSAAAIGTKVYGQVRAGKDAQAAANYNAAIYNQQAQAVESKKKIVTVQHDRLIRKLQGEIVSAVAGSGYKLGGSFLEVMNDRMTQAQLDKQVDIYNLDVERAQALSAAEEERRVGERARRSANVQALSTILTQGNLWYQRYGGMGTTVTPGRGGYGFNTPAGVRNMGTWSKL